MRITSSPRRERPRVHLSQRLLLAGFVSHAPPPGLFFSSFARTLPPKALALHPGMDAVVGIHSLRSLILRVPHLRAGEGGRTRRVDPSSLVESLRIVFAARRCRKCPCPCLEAPLCIFPLCFPDPTTLVELPYCGRPQAHTVFVCVSLPCISSTRWRGRLNGRRACCRCSPR
ncbi:hypothetical protein B0H14DRAFT_549530 [Mycena olivaceomarginata]|nr:hypothetical protein B0H14DRAFT_549530 [Mycena olivaceomarginata]